MNIIIIVFFSIITLIIGTILVLLWKTRITRANLNNNMSIDTVDANTIRILLEDKSLEKCNTFIDSIITDSLNMYKILNVVIDETYITKEDITEMEQYVFGMTMNKMTPAVKQTIGLFYDVSTDSKLEELLKLRIKLYIIASVVEQNKPIE